MIYELQEWVLKHRELQTKTSRLQPRNVSMFLTEASVCTDVKSKTTPSIVRANFVEQIVLRYCMGVRTCRSRSELHFSTKIDNPTHYDPDVHHIINSCSLLPPDRIYVHFVIVNGPGCNGELLTH